MMFGACTSLLDAMRAGRLHTVTLVLADLESDGWRIPVGADLAAMYCGVPAATVVQPPARRVEQNGDADLFLDWFTSLNPSFHDTRSDSDSQESS